GEMSQVVRSAAAWFPGEGVVTLEGTDLELGYRRSIFSRRRGAVLSAVLELTEGNREQIRARMDEFNRRRREKQPLEFPSAGSTFKRPEGHFAGALIEQCGLKGTRTGGAQVSEKHAGFVVNTGNASCADVLALIEHIQKTVKAQTGVTLEPEVRIV
nr:UDP-N-acetylenolpyruvoylglucosamine reductase [Oscillospiraceae bacterium]